MKRNLLPLSLAAVVSLAALMTLVLLQGGGQEPQEYRSPPAGEAILHLQTERGGVAGEQASSKQAKKARSMAKKRREAARRKQSAAVRKRRAAKRRRQRSRRQGAGVGRDRPVAFQARRPAAVRPASAAAPAPAPAAPAPRAKPRRGGYRARVGFDSIG